MSNNLPLFQVLREIQFCQVVRCRQSLLFLHVPRGCPWHPFCPTASKNCIKCTNYWEFGYLLLDQVVLAFHLNQSILSLPEDIDGEVFNFVHFDHCGVLIDLLTFGPGKPMDPSPPHFPRSPLGPSAPCRPTGPRWPAGPWGNTRLSIEMPIYGKCTMIYIYLTVKPFGPSTPTFPANPSSPWQQFNKTSIKTTFLWHNLCTYSWSPISHITFLSSKTFRPLSTRKIIIVDCSCQN